MRKETPEADGTSVIAADKIRLEHSEADAGRLIVQFNGTDSLERLQSILAGGSREQTQLPNNDATADQQTGGTTIETDEWDLLIQPVSPGGTGSSTSEGGVNTSPESDRLSLPVADTPQAIKDEYHDDDVSHAQLRDLIFGTVASEFAVDPQAIETAETIAADGRSAGIIDKKAITDLLACFCLAGRIENDPIPISWLGESWMVFSSEETIRDSMNRLKDELELSVPSINPAVLVDRVVARLPDAPLEPNPEQHKRRLLPTATFIAGYFFSEGVCQTKNSLSVAGASIYIADTLADSSLNQQRVADACPVSTRSIARAYPILEEAIAALPFILRPRILDDEACLQLREHSTSELVRNELNPMQFTTIKGRPLDSEFIQSLPAPREYSKNIQQS